MSAKDPSKIFIHDLVSQPIPQRIISENQDILKAEDFEGDTSPFRTATIDSVTTNDIYQNPSLRPDDDRAVSQANGVTENDQHLCPTPPEIAAPTDTG